MPSFRIPSLYLLKDNILLQWPGFFRLLNSDLIIIVNANRNILNITLLLLSKLGFLKVALWGHGRSYQANDKSLLEKLKRKVAVMPYWWFSYTDNVSEYLVSIGFNRKKITLNIKIVCSYQPKIISRIVRCDIMINRGCSFWNF